MNMTVREILEKISDMETIIHAISTGGSADYYYKKIEKYLTEYEEILRSLEVTI